MSSPNRFNPLLGLLILVLGSGLNPAILEDSTLQSLGELLK